MKTAVDSIIPPLYVQRATTVLRLLSTMVALFFAIGIVPSFFRVVLDGFTHYGNLLSIPSPVAHEG